jgi:hypothetical protein
MKRSSTMRLFPTLASCLLASRLLASCLLASCLPAPPAPRSPSRVVRHKPERPTHREERAQFRLLGSETTYVDAWHYDFAREASPITVDLRAVTVTHDKALAFGDGGVIFTRTHDGPWTQAPSPTRERLRGAWRDVYAVGDRGTWLTGRDGRWNAEETGVAEDLYAVTPVGPWAFAVGDGGVLVERAADGRFTRVDTGTRARLRSIWGAAEGLADSRGFPTDEIYLVGDGGTIVDCALRMSPPVCVPRASPTSENLMQILDATPTAHAFRAAGAGLLSVLVLGDAGTTLGVTLGRLVPYDFRAVPLHVPPGMERVLVSRARRTDGKIAVEGDRVFPPIVTVGAGGRGALLDATRVVPFALPEVGDLHDVAGDELEIFAVGDAGSIVHGRMRGAVEVIPIMYLL